MTGRTHDLAAFTALNMVVLGTTLPHMSLATALVAFSANMIGGLAPDIDQPTGDLWHKLPAGSLYSRLITPFLGGHRSVSHSLFGIVLFGVLSSIVLNTMSHVLLVDMNVVWWSFMIGFISHLLMDTITREGVPWLFPVPIKFGFPPFEFLRVKTGGLVEKSVVFPGLILINAYLVYSHYAFLLKVFHGFR
ncbi:MAG TPA: metal-dependent hydrolase [Patescibacteria group bacterium]|nr:metal-dependent hydrolase [Patescibacteria group bacterium]